MKTALAVSLLFSLSLGLGAQSGTSAAADPASQPAAQGGQATGPGLNAILSELQRTTAAANLDLSRLRIERWKADDSQKQQMQQVAASLQKNITLAVPGLISDVQAAPGSVLRAFKLYDDLTVVYEFLNSLSEAAGAYGKREEYAPLAGDASALDAARQSLSSYIEQAAHTLEIQAQKPVPAPKPVPAVESPKKIIIDDDNPPPKKTHKKKKPATAPASSPSPSPPQ